MTFTIETAREFLDCAQIFFTTQKEFEEIKADPNSDQYDIEDAEFGLQMINLNDVWTWALADGTKVEDEELPELARLFWKYGYCGMLYWAAKKEGIEKSQFVDINRFIEFVKNEEQIIAEEPNWNKRAFYHKEYKIGENLLTNK